MPRKAKGIHTSPETAGEQNMTPENLKKIKTKPLGDEGEYLEKVLPILNKSLNMIVNRTDYKGKWTEDTLANEISDFFAYCIDNELEPCPPLLKMWLNITDDTDWRWRKEDCGFKTEIYKEAYRLMEMRYFSKLDRYPVPNMFKLKTVHGYIEPSKTETTVKLDTTEDDIKTVISKLGLNK